jgi:hypothetical protein
VPFFSAHSYIPTTPISAGSKQRAVNWIALRNIRKEVKIDATKAWSSSDVLIACGRRHWRRRRDCQRGERRLRLRLLIVNRDCALEQQFDDDSVRE